MPSKSAPKGASPRRQWPAWTDDSLWELGPVPHGPTEADAQWAAESLNGDDFHTDDPTPDDVLDSLAEEAESQARYGERESAALELGGRVTAANKNGPGMLKTAPDPEAQAVMRA